MGGEAYDGPPKFEVLFDGKRVGEGTVGSAIDTATAGRFAQTAVKAPYIESFEFDIPDDVFNAGGEVRIRFLNEAYGGDGSNRDRNLYLASIAVNGLEVPATAMTTQSAQGLEPSAILGEFLVIFDGTADGVAMAPDSGWPAAGDVDVAAVAPEPEPAAEPEPPAPEPAAEPGLPAPEPEAEPEPQPDPEVAIAAAPAAETPAAEPPVAEVAETPAVDPVETAAVPAPVETATLEVPEAPVPVPAPAPEVVAAPAAEAVAAPAAVEVATAEEPAAPEETSGCALDNLYNVLGFNENSNDLTSRVTDRLDQIIKDIGSNVCAISLTGYSSTQGDFDTNALFAIERAQKVLRYLRENGLRYTSANAVGAGETDQFGPAFSDNRRVVITVTP